MSKFKGVKLPSEIAENEKDLFHVCLIKTVPNMETMEFKHSLRITTYNEVSWGVSKKLLGGLGWKHHFIFHDPTIVENGVDSSDGKTGGEEPKVDEAKAKKEAETKSKAEAEAKAKESGSENKPTDPTVKEGFPELKKRAAELGMPVSNNTKKVEVEAWLAKNDVK